MLDQIFGQFFSSQWIVFASLVILLVGLSELAWRMGLAYSRKKSEADKGSGTVRSAVLALLGLLLGFSFAIAAARHETRRRTSGRGGKLNRHDRTPGAIVTRVARC